METELSLPEIKKEYHGTLSAYIVGFISCLVLTGISFSLVVTKALDGDNLLYALALLAIVQAFFQLLCFLHLGQEAKPRWESIIFWFMTLVLLIIVAGSLWIMYDLDERMMVGM